MRQLLRNLVIESVGQFRSIKDGIHILNGHFISSNNDISQDVFFNQLKQLSKYADFVDPITACEIINDKKNYNDKLIAFTFDDGFEECYTKISPVLDSYNIKGGFFINPNFHLKDKNYQDDFLKNKVRNPHKSPMTIEMIQQLSKNGHIIGAHTMDHQRLNITNVDELEYQIIQCKSEIKRITLKDCDAFAWPYGTLNDINNLSTKMMTENYKYVFSSCYNKYYKTNNEFYNRRHFEGDWSITHLKYFLAKKEFNINLK